MATMTESYSKWLDALSVFCKATTTHAAADAPINFTVFHSSALPNISLADYITRLDRHVDAGEESVALCFVLIGRYTRSTGKSPSLLSMHRLFITALRVVTKMQHDQFRSNRTFARYGGLRIDELCRLEAHLLHCVKFDVFFRQEDLDIAMAFIQEAARADNDIARVNAVAAVLQVASPHTGSFDVSSRDVSPSATAANSLLSVELRGGNRRASTPGGDSLALVDLAQTTPSTTSMFLSLNPNVSATSLHNAFHSDNERPALETSTVASQSKTTQIDFSSIAVAPADPPRSASEEPAQPLGVVSTAGSGVAMVRALRTAC